MTERELSRIAAHRLAVLRHATEVSGDVSKTYRYYGITRQSFYKWQRRYAQLGEAGLRDRSSRPHRSPRATREEVVGKIVYLRQTYHFGPLKIAMYLRRYHDLTLSQSGIWRILRRLGLSRLPASQRYRRYRERWKRYEKPQPGHQVQIDAKSIAPLRGARKTYYQCTAIDDGTRLRVLRIYDRLGQKSAIQFVDYVLEKLPFHVERTQTDNGSEFQAAFHWHVLDRGIDHVYIKPATPRLNGKVERSQRIDAEEFYRMHRPHGSLGGQTPYERLRQRVGSSVSDQRQLHTVSQEGIRTPDLFLESDAVERSGPANSSSTN